MIQRKQTLYLLAVVILTTIQLLNPLTTIVFNIHSEGVELMETLELKAFSIGSLVENMTSPISIYYGTFAIITTLLALGAIFLFKNRILQMRITMFASLLAIITFITEALYVYSILSAIKDNAVEWVNKFSISAFFPIVSAILLLIAHRLILKDEVLIKANERFR